MSAPIRTAVSTVISSGSEVTTLVNTAPTTEPDSPLSRAIVIPARPMRNPTTPTTSASAPNQPHSARIDVSDSSTTSASSTTVSAVVSGLHIGRSLTRRTHVSPYR